VDLFDTGYCAGPSKQVIATLFGENFDGSKMIRRIQWNLNHPKSVVHEYPTAIPNLMRTDSPTDGDKWELSKIPGQLIVH
jgi:hypothetical protein